MSRFLLTHSMQDLGDLIRWIGILPFFPCGIPGYSVEESVIPELLWGKEPGPWEWKGPMIRQGLCLYGKHVSKRAAFISPEWFPDLVNFRRNGYDFEGFSDDGLAPYKDKLLMAWMERHAPALSRDAKQSCGFSKGYETVATRLQMQTFLTSADFTYSVDKYGKPYGWGNAVLTTPERLLGEEQLNSVDGRTPEESLERIVCHLHDCMPDVQKDTLVEILR